MAKRVAVSASAARRIALAAQGFDDARSSSNLNAGSLRRAVDRLGLLQIDSVNVLTRAHYLPLFSRLGNYRTDHLDQIAWGRKSRRGLFEFWAHEASLLPVSSHPLWRWRMERAARAHAGDIKNKLHVFRREKGGFIDEVRRQLHDRGALAASDLDSGTGKTGPWWGWSDAKFAMEWLFFAGEVTTATRRGAFERVYDLTERVLPAEIMALPTPDEAEAQRELIRRSAAALGVACATDLRDYFRLPAPEFKTRLAELVEAGDLVPVEVEGWKQTGYLARCARQPRQVEAHALLAPFDPLIWERDRTLRLFDFHYRIGIYTPVAQRTHGYYVLPFLLGDRLVGRVDLKSDRTASKLLVHAVHFEKGVRAAEVVEPLRAELRLMADWLGLEGLAGAGMKRLR